MDLTKTVKLPEEISEEDAERLMQDPAIVAGLEAYQRRNYYPRRWKPATQHAYRFEVFSGFRMSLEAELPKDGFFYKICDDCGTHVWIKMGDQKFHLSMRLSDFVNITPDIQVKPTGTILWVRRTRPIIGVGYCHYAAD